MELTNVLVASFDDISLPPYVLVLGKRICLKPFVQKMFRYNHCSHFGHVSKICKSSSLPIICIKCGESGHSIEVCQAMTHKCINCVRSKRMFINHQANDNKCPVYVFQRELRLIMSSRCLSLREAEFLYKRGLRYQEPKVDFWPTSTLADFIDVGNMTYADVTRKNLHGKAEKSAGCAMNVSSQSNAKQDAYPDSDRCGGCDAPLIYPVIIKRMRVSSRDISEQSESRDQDVR